RRSYIRRSTGCGTFPVLAKIRYRQDSFVLERNGIPMARLVPTEGSRCSVGEALASWTDVFDESFADALEHIDPQNARPEIPWASS
ncbi:MAG: hypothetical protein OSB03_06475, partial [Vicinamibacterales bacterium]|nr:hypothetical protein [Vicinamibacterales bacterium]